MNVRISAEAERDLESIGDWIARDNPARAVAFIRELSGKCLDLAEFPERFPLLAGYEEQALRYRVHGNYLIFYRVEGEEVIVIHILHGAMNYTDVLFPS